ncbi:hypothetical protein QFC19_006779 [Naganishia cerealis]|uniref:Uncharacterized protein n=1 Tax=Naganishia cerealis TaxID=610337 RepID=A0ACC2VEK0_9TREE|nr:hypothetical protein QFC19_006779 [Naganishia cerealis]
MTPTKSTAGGAGFFDSPSMREPEKRARAGRRRHGGAATSPHAPPPPATMDDGRQSMFDPPALSSLAPHAQQQRQPNAQKSIHDSPVLSKRSTTSATAQAQGNGGATLKPNGRSVFSIPLQQPEAGTDRAATGAGGKPRTAAGKRGKKATSGGVGSTRGNDDGHPPTTTTGAGGSWYSSATLQDILDELSSRFILHLPEEELASPERVCFQIEQAHWFYEDFIREEAPTLPTYRLKDFCKIFIAHCPLLSSQWGNDAASERLEQGEPLPAKEEARRASRARRVVYWPSSDLECWKAGSSWGFPKGKMNNEEPKHLCAIREVEEETGYNCASLLNEQDYIQITMNDQEITLFVVTGVPEETEFKPQTRKEISGLALIDPLFSQAIEWFRLGELPTWSRKRIDQRPAKFFMIAPFVVPLKTWMRQMMDAAGTASDETDDVDDKVVHIDPEHHEHDQHNQFALSPSVPPATAAAQQEGITATTNGEPSVFDDLFSKFTLASEKKEVKHGAEQRQRADETRADPAMQELLGKLMMAHEGRHDGPSSSSVADERLQVDSNPLAPAVDARTTSSHIGDDSKQGKQQALMDKLMSSLGATPSKPSPSEYTQNNHPAPAPLPQNMQHVALLPSTPSKQSTAPMGIRGMDQSPRLHHPYSSINGAGLPVPTHSPALAALSGHAHPALTQPHFHGPLSGPLQPPHASNGPPVHGGYQPHTGPLSNVTSNLLNILTPPRPAGAIQFPHATNGTTGHHLPHGFPGTAMPDASAQNLGPARQPVGHMSHPTMPYSNTQPLPLAQPQHSVFGMHTSPQPPMAQTQNFASMLSPTTTEHYAPNGPLPGPIQLPLHSGMPELNRILPYQMLPAHSIETNNGYPLHGHPAPPQFQQLHSAQMFSPPHQPASVVQAHPLLSLLNPRPNVPGIGSPPMTTAKTADGLLAMLVGNGRHEGGNG